MAKTFKQLTAIGLSAFIVIVVLDYYFKSSKDNSELRSILQPSSLSDGFVYNCITGDRIGRYPLNSEAVSLELPIESDSKEDTSERSQAFEAIFKSRKWIKPGQRKFTEMVASGPGSIVSYTAEAMAGLHAIISQIKQVHGVSKVRLLDVPCGDMVWMSRFLKTRDDIVYTGVDIVPDIIDHHKKKYAKHQWTFKTLDIVMTPLTEQYDLILCRMMLQHLFTKDVFAVLKRFSDSGSRYLLTTTFHRRSSNIELVKERRFRQLNMELPPFSLIPPMCTFRDGEPEDENGRTHSLALWSLPLKQMKKCNNTVKFSVDTIEGSVVSCIDWSWS